jgi:hypothetical protein
LEVTRFEVDGKSRPAHLNYLYTEGLLGAGESEADWEVKRGPAYRFGIGAIHRGPGGTAKWNFIGTGVRLWSPMGTDLGKVQVSVDGGAATVLDLKSVQSRGPVMIWEKDGLRSGPHCLVVRSLQGAMALDAVEVIASGR